jgi:hypothetical protein
VLPTGTMGPGGRVATPCSTTVPYERSYLLFYLQMIRFNNILLCMPRCSKQAVASSCLTKILPAGSTSPCILHAPAVFGFSIADNITVLYTWRLKLLQLKPTAQISLRDERIVSLPFYEILRVCFTEQIV